MSLNFPCQPTPRGQLIQVPAIGGDAASEEQKLRAIREIRAFQLFVGRISAPGYEIEDGRTAEDDVRDAFYFADIFIRVAKELQDKPIGGIT